MKKEYTIIITQDEDGYYIADVPELQGCHTQAKSIDKLRDRIKEAIELCLEEKAQDILPLILLTSKKLQYE